MSLLVLILCFNETVIQLLLPTAIKKLFMGHGPAKEQNPAKEQSKKATGSGICPSQLVFVLGTMQ